MVHPAGGAAPLKALLKLRHQVRAAATSEPGDSGQTVCLVRTDHGNAGNGQAWGEEEARDSGKVGHQWTD